MTLFHQVFKLTPAQRRAISALAVILLLTSTRVQAAEVTTIVPDTSTDEVQNDTVQATQAPVTNSLKPAESKPVVKKSWNAVNAPDLAAPVAYSDAPAARTITVPVSAYTSEPGQTDASPFTTADGSQVRDGILAANFLPIGTRVRIPEYFGNKVFEVHDRMNARYAYRADIWMLNKTTALSWGIRNVKMEIL